MLEKKKKNSHDKYEQFKIKYNTIFYDYTNTTGNVRKKKKFKNNNKNSFFVHTRLCV